MKGIEIENTNLSLPAMEIICWETIVCVDKKVHLKKTYTKSRGADGNLHEKEKWSEPMACSCEKPAEVLIPQEVEEKIKTFIKTHQ
jgi:hypothetical protein